MKVAKVKSSKQRARLKARIDAYESISSTDKPSYTKPGSNKK